MGSHVPLQRPGRVPAYERLDLVTRQRSRWQTVTPSQVVGVRLSEIRRAWREAWRAWEESCKRSVKTMRRSGGKGASTVEANEMKAQSGNPAFLDRIFDGICAEARSTRTEAPQQQRVESAVCVQDFSARIQAASARRAPLPAERRSFEATLWGVASAEHRSTSG